MTMMRSVWEEKCQGHILRVSKLCEIKFTMRSLNPERAQKEHSWQKRERKKRKRKWKIKEINQFYNSSIPQAKTPPTQEMPLISHVTKVMAWLPDTYFEPFFFFFFSNGTMCCWLLLWNRQENLSLKSISFLPKKMSYEGIGSNLQNPHLGKQP